MRADSCFRLCIVRRGARLGASRRGANESESESEDEGERVRAPRSLQRCRKRVICESDGESGDADTTEGAARGSGVLAGA